MPATYPLIFEPILLSKVWGGTRLAAFGKRVNPGERIGESWEVADLAATSAGGAGGGAFRSRILNGALAGKTLHDAMLAWGRDLTGRESSDDAGYPLLVKYLDAAENLSVQVHPSRAYAASHTGAHLKSECWFVLAAEPGSMIYKGLRPGVTREKFARAISEGSIIDLLASVPAVPGECHFVPSGTCHAVGAGVLVLEVQTASDTTFRVYDWGRAGRDLHIVQALECIDFDRPPPPPVILERGSPLVTPYFTLTRRQIGSGGVPLGAVGGGPFMVIGGRGQLEDWEDHQPPIRLEAGASGLIPAGLQGPSRLAGEDDSPLVCLFASLSAAS